jgi:hypothetical protein
MEKSTLLIRPQTLTSFSVNKTKNVNFNFEKNVDEFIMLLTSYSNKFFKICVRLSNSDVC